MLHAVSWKCRTQIIAKNSPSGHHRTTLSGYIFATKARIDNWGKNLLNSNVSPTCPHNIGNFNLAADICWRVWGTPANFNGFRVGMRGIKKCPTIIYRLKKYRDTGIPRYFVTSSIADNFCKNQTVRIICSALTDFLCHIMLMILCANFVPLDMVVMLLAFMLEL